MSSVDPTTDAPRPDDLPPVPLAATSYDDLAAGLRELRAWAGEPSFSALARRIAQQRKARGVPPGDATPGRVTVYDCFKDGRRRLDVGLVMDIVAALGADSQLLATWRRSIRRVISPGAGPVQAEVVRDPAVPEPFVGRESERAEVRELMRQSPVVLHGMAGMGKTALALHLAHGMAGPLGAPVLLVNLRGFTADQEPVEPDSVVDALLLALDLDAPLTGGGQAHRVRDVLVRSPAAIILDNAASTEQVRGIIRALGEPAGLLITSRGRLDGLDSVAQVQLSEIAESDAVELLGTLAGIGTAGEAQLVTLAQLAGRLPLALSLMGRRLAAHPDWSLSDHIEAYRTRLTLLQLDQGVQAALELSYAALQPSEQFLLRGLSWHPAQSIEMDGIEALTGGSVPRLGEVLGALSAANLVRPLPGERWELHDLVRAFAAARSFDTDPPSRRIEAVERLVAGYESRAVAAVATVQPQARSDWWWCDPDSVTGMDLEEASAWLDAERANLLACATWAAQHERPHVVLRLACVLAHDLWRRGDVETTVELHRAAIVAAEQIPDDFGRAMAKRNLANTLIRIGQFAAARPHLEEALMLLDEGSSARISTLNSMAILASATGDQATAIASLTELVQQLRGDRGSRDRLALTLSNLAVTLARAGRTREAIDLFSESADVAASAGLEEQERVALGNLAGMLVEAGQASEGLRVAQRAVALSERVDDPLSLAYARSNLGLALHMVDRHAEADEQWRQALRVARDVAAPDLEASVLNHVGDGHRRLDEFTEAERAYREALAVAESVGEANEIDRARAGLAALS